MLDRETHDHMRSSDTKNSHDLYSRHSSRNTNKAEIDRGSVVSTGNAPGNRLANFEVNLRLSSDPHSGHLPCQIQVNVLMCFGSTVLYELAACVNSSSNFN